jgi:hypothetical protein
MNTFEKLSRHILRLMKSPLASRCWRARHLPLGGLVTNNQVVYTPNFFYLILKFDLCAHNVLLILRNASELLTYVPHHWKVFSEEKKIHILWILVRPTWMWRDDNSPRVHFPPKRKRCWGTNLSNQVCSTHNYCMNDSSILFPVVYHWSQVTWCHGVWNRVIMTDTRDITCALRIHYTEYIMYEIQVCAAKLNRSR